jgi:hypothetical protein
MEYELGLKSNNTLQRPVVFQDLSDDYGQRPGTSIESNIALKEKFKALRSKTLNSSA